MAAFGRQNSTSRNSGARGRSWQRTTPDSTTLGIIGLICAVVGFFVLGIVLGPVAVICGWLAMGRTWKGPHPIPPLVAVVLGAIDTLLAIIWLASATGPTTGLF
ncbi:small hydrophobic protein [Streptomyces sp. SID12501]|uniref:Small hydrophobic protein n=1 Tax=Streptomyces sp. SID12501 TaxID=2706042 RepID=A0A6B3BR48_9ACTN|nr:small hydrophobic protein [Streptomyces sp. SID12501]NEC86814.1 small hydrophobic protein [Streptomyces sp. SID12501]